MAYGGMVMKMKCKDVVNLILQRMEEKEAEGKPFFWVQPWTGGAKVPMSWVSQKPYRGVNALLLENGEYLTKKAIRKYGGRLKEKAMAHTIVFFTKFRREEDDRLLSVYRHFTVYHIDDVDGVETHFPPQEHQFEVEYEEVDLALETVCKNMGFTLNKVKGTSRCYCNTTKKLLQVAEKHSFSSVYGYYSAVLHELVHATAPSLQRKHSGTRQKERYSQEELVAQIGSQMLLNWFGIVPEPGDFENDVAYIAGWSSFLKERRKAIFVAGTQAQKAFDFITNIVMKEG